MITMSPLQLKDLVTSIVQAWPVWSPEGRQSLLRNHLSEYEHQRALEGINALISEFTGSGGPSIGDIREAISRVKITKPFEPCEKCDNTGWLQVDEKGHGSYKKCSCDNPVDLSRRPIHGAELTSEGLPAASLDESCWALYRGMRDYIDENAEYPVSDQEIISKLSTAFPQRAKRLEELLDEREKLQDIF